MTPLDLNDLAVFVRVVDQAGFARAAREMRVPTSTVSRAIARLEASLGTRLVQRTTRSVTPTAEGRAFYAEVAPAVATLRSAAQLVDGADMAPRGRLRVTAPTDLGGPFLARILVEFVQTYPELAIDIELTSRRVNLVEEGFDVALRAAEKLPDSTLVARKIGEAEGTLFASASYLERHGAPHSLAALADHPCILFRGRNGQAEWTFYGPGGKESCTVNGAISADDFSFVRASTIADGGISMLPTFIVADEIASGRLVRVLPQYTSMRGSALHVVYAGVPKVPAKIVAFRDFMVAAFAKVLTFTHGAELAPSKTKGRGASR